MEKFVTRKAIAKKPAEGRSSLVTSPDAVAHNDENISPKSPEPVTDPYKRAVNFFDEAKETSKVKSCLQQLTFTEPFPQKDYWLFEVDNELVQALEQGEELVLRGDSSDSAVLCTASKTFSVSAQQTSNSLLLTPNLRLAADVDDPKEGRLDVVEVTSLLSQTMELTLIPRPSPTRARELLRVRELKWDQLDDDDLENLPSFDDLLERVQMSRKELRALLERWPVVEIDYHLRWLSFDFRDALLNEIVDACDGDVSDINVENMTYESLRKHLKNPCVKNEIIHWFLRSFCNIDDDGVTWRLDERPVVRARVAHLLRAAATLPVETFERLLDQLLPHPLSLKYEYLEGLAIVDETLKGRCVQYLNVDDLPEDPRERLELLLRVRAEWTKDDLEPYLEDICESKGVMSELLVNICRSTTNAQGQHVFVALR